jgi:hypothetical protein
MPLDDEIDISQDSAWAVSGDEPTLMDAIDAASDQDHITWITNSGRRIAKIAPVDEISDNILDRPGTLREMTGDEITRIARDELDELLEFAGQIRAAMRATRQAYDALFGASGARLLRAQGPQALPLICGQAVLFGRLGRAEWEPGMFIRYDETGHAVLQDRDGHPVAGVPRHRVIAAVPADLSARLTAKRAETEPAWQASLDAAEPEKLAVSRGLLVQVLTDAGLDEAKAEITWETLRDLILGSPSGRPEDPAPGKMTPRGPITLEILLDALSLAGVPVRMETLAEWDFGKRADAYDWAIREHLHASDNDVPRVTRPGFIPGAETHDG